MSDHEKRDDDDRDEDAADAEAETAAGATSDRDGDPKEELFEAIDHFKNAASILFNRATKDPTVKTATKEAERIARKIGDAAEPLAKQLTSELSRLTRDVMGAVEGKPKKRPKAQNDPDEE